MTARRCGILLPSGKPCPTFLGAQQNVCAKHAAGMHTVQSIADARARYGAPDEVDCNLLLLIPQPRRKHRLRNWVLTHL